MLEAAATVIERDGVEALTMRRIAAELQASPMALYRHVRDKDQLLVALLDRLAPRRAEQPLPSDPAARVLVVCRLMRDALAQHSWVVAVLAKGDLIAPSVLWMIDEILAGLLACGLDEAQAVAGYRAIWQFTVGELVLAQGLAQLDRPPFVLAVLEGVDARELPTLAAVASLWRSTRGSDAYDVGLAAMLNGLLRADS